MVSRRFRNFILVSAIVSAACPAFADDFGGYGDRGRQHGHHGHWGHFGHHGHRGGSWRQTYGGGYGVPVLIPGQGTYAGAISALRVRGHGTYYYMDCPCQDFVEIEPRPTAKIIDVAKSDPCSYENGVCVIRP